MNLQTVNAKQRMIRWRAVQDFRQMWRWMAKEAIKRKRIIQKDEYFVENKIECCPEYYCYLCGYAEYGCTECPVDWGSERCTDDDSIYKKWYYATHFFKDRESIHNIVKSAFLCYRISCLPEKGK